MQVHALTKKSTLSQNNGMNQKQIEARRKFHPAENCMQVYKQGS